MLTFVRSNIKICQPLMQLRSEKAKIRRTGRRTDGRTHTPTLKTEPISNGYVELIAACENIPFYDHS